MLAENESPCLDEDTLLAVVEARLGPDERKLAERHLDDCADCRMVVAALARGTVGAEEDSITDVVRRAEDELPAPLAQRYELMRCLNTGPHGSLFAARDHERGELVAIKWIHAGWVKDADAVELLRTAVERAKRISHPNVARVLGFHTVVGVVVVVSELVEGTSLDEFIATGITPTLAREVVAQLCAALAEAHGSGVCHGGLKPENVIVDLSGHVHVTDFGLRGALRGAVPTLDAGGARADVAALCRLSIDVLSKNAAEPSALRAIMEFGLDDPTGFASAMELDVAVRAAVGPVASLHKRLLRDGVQWVPKPGELIAGKYKVETVIGSGGMGAVVAAIHSELDRRVAVKLMPPRTAQKPSGLERFLREAKTAAAIENEHVVKIFDVGRSESGAPYMVMEYLVGATLAQLVARRGALPVAEAVDYALQICVAVADCHARGIVHRDLKPANVMVLEVPGQRGVVKVLDFGISKADWNDDAEDVTRLTRTAELVGTPTHMSPEQVRSAKDVDARTDIWSLGVILYELLTGQPPFIARSIPALSAMIVSDEPVAPRQLRPGIPAEIEGAIMDCLAKAREGRPADVLALAERLAPFAPAAAQVTLDHIRDVAESLRGERRSSIPSPPRASSLPPVRKVSLGEDDLYEETRGTFSRRVTARALMIGAAVGTLVFLLFWLLFSLVASDSGDEPRAQTPAPAPTSVRTSLSDFDEEEPDPPASLSTSNASQVNDSPTRARRRVAPPSPLEGRR
jgi:eukaryotic-like serine/threonine-protein kinase